MRFSFCDKDLQMLLHYSPLLKYLSLYNLSLSLSLSLSIHIYIYTRISIYIYICIYTYEI